MKDKVLPGNGSVMEMISAKMTASTVIGEPQRLMMRHHPDVDPSGLERCKDVNVAYALLIAEAAAGP